MNVLSLCFRSCIRPEVSRTSTFGKKGVSHGQYYEQHLKYIVLNANPYDFLASDLNYLLKVCLVVQYVCISYSVLTLIAQFIVDNNYNACWCHVVYELMSVQLFIT